MKKYREHLRVFGAFVDEYAERPFDEERYHDGFSQEKEATQRAKKDGPKEEEEHEAAGEEEECEEVDPMITLNALVEMANSGNFGGESPFPDLDTDY